jgi:hypothetical protein
MAPRRVKFTTRSMLIAILFVAVIFAFVAESRETYRRRVAAGAALVALKNARLNRVAKQHELRLKLGERKILEAEDVVCRRALARAEAEIARAESQRSAAEKAGDKQWVERTRSMITRAHENRSVLTRARDRRAKLETTVAADIKRLLAEVEKAEADELGKQRAVERFQKR